MEPVGIQRDVEGEKNRRWKSWILFFILAFIFHFLIFRIRWDLPTSSVPAPVEIQSVNPKQLNALRKKWQQKPLFLEDGKPHPETHAPSNSRYDSNHTIHVEKEQKAAQGDLLPKVAVPGQPPAKEKRWVQTPSKSSQPRQPRGLVPNLGMFGIPFRLDGKGKAPLNSQRPESPSVAQQGRSQSILDDQLPIGSETLLNAQESIYYSFFSRLYEAIAPIWQSKIREIPAQRHILPGGYRTVVDVVLDSEGNLTGVQRIQSSGIAEFDQAVDSSWKKIGHFPNPPKGLLNADGLVHTGWSFSVEVSEGFNIQYMPPSRTY